MKAGRKTSQVSTLHRNLEGGHRISGKVKAIGVDIMGDLNTIAQATGKCQPRDSKCENAFRRVRLRVDVASSIYLKC